MGEWDAPWEGNEPTALHKSEVSQALSVAQLDTRQILYIQVTDGPLLGWVNRYDHDPVGSIVWAGINICQSGSWGQGLGTEALRLWTDYLFKSLDVTTIKAGTWSGNMRMIRCAEKCGFVLANRIPDLREVRGRLYDGLEFTLTRNTHPGIAC